MVSHQRPTDAWFHIILVGGAAWRGWGGDNSSARSLIFKDHCYEEVHTSDTGQKEQDLGGGPCRKVAGWGVCKG